MPAHVRLFSVFLSPFAFYIREMRTERWIHTNKRYEFCLHQNHIFSPSLSRLSSVAWQICKNVHFFVVVSIAWRAENIDTIRGSQTQVQRLSRLLFFRFLWNGYRRLLHTRNVGTAPRAKNVHTKKIQMRITKYFKRISKSLRTRHSYSDNVASELLDDSICGMPRMRELCKHL